MFRSPRILPPTVNLELRMPLPHPHPYPPARSGQPDAVISAASRGHTYFNFRKPQRQGRPGRGGGGRGKYFAAKPPPGIGRSPRLRQRPGGWSNLQSLKLNCAVRRIWRKLLLIQQSNAELQTQWLIIYLEYKHTVRATPPPPNFFSVLEWKGVGWGERWESLLKIPLGGGEIVPNLKFRANVH